MTITDQMLKSNILMYRDIGGLTARMGFSERMCTWEIAE